MKKNKHKTEDQVIRELFQNSFQPGQIKSEDFNRNIMDQVMSEWVSQSNYYQPLVDKKNRWWILPGIAVLFIVGYLFDLTRIGSASKEAMLLSNMASALQSLYSWIEPIHIIILGASAAIGLLLALDRFFQKLSNI
ncbi:hypothetical protein [Marinilabilia rubra]|uniref:DUF5056 domain-containing protein n=1 Tax=Marinilabilia rubra TaxID=2162893 RepID=A0A2U2B7P2_9BACT|nr:hypothetical protein [Marinilabilia rubra]PWD99066.1 hypothetical protein DDZ16_12450 [Marinilabilia rubra]